MRTTPFKDVLHGVARKFGLDPEQSNFLTNQAISIGDYINQWVRRQYPAIDIPEWVKTKPFQPNAVTHLVPWGTGIIPPGLTTAPVPIERVIQVFLVDPNTADSPVETPFTLTEDGIHCGFDHGAQVWIRYMEPAPIFTAVEWDPSETYARGDVRYSNVTGECYKSKVNNNLGHDPSILYANTPPSLQTQIVQERTSDNPGTAIKNRIIDVTLAIQPSINATIPDPPPNLSTFYIPIIDSTGLLTSATHVADGVETLQAILADLAAQLTAGVPTFTITTDVLNLTIRIEAAQDFWVSWSGNNAYYVPQGGPNYPMVVKSIQAFVPQTAAAFGNPQITQIALTNDNIVSYGTYNIIVRDNNGGEHSVQYQATPTDAGEQILAGLLNAINDSGDPFFADVDPAIDLALMTITLTVRDTVSVDANLSITTSPYWEIVLFPTRLVDQVIRGATADLNKEWGQTDKGLAEEQIVPTEQRIASDVYETTPNPPLVGQQRPLSRYKL